VPGGPAGGYPGLKGTSCRTETDALFRHPPTGARVETPVPQPYGWRVKRRTVLRILSAGLVLLGSAFFVYESLAARQSLERLKSRTGAEIQCGHWSRDMLGAKFSLRDLKVFAPRAQGGALLLELPRLDLELDSSAWRRGVIRVRQMRVEIREMNLSNPELIRSVMEGLAPPGEGGGRRFESIDRLHVRWDQLRLSPERSAPIRLGIEDQVFRDVRHWSDLAPLAKGRLSLGQWARLLRDAGQMVPSKERL
jgi:hypothetical protein